MSTIAIRNKSSHKAQWIAFGLTLGLLILAIYTVNNHRDTTAVEAWSADSSWKGGWNE